MDSSWNSFLWRSQGSRLYWVTVWNNKRLLCCWQEFQAVSPLAHIRWRCWLEVFITIWSGNLWFLWKASCIGASLGQTREGTFHWSKYRWKDVLLKQAHGRTHDELVRLTLHWWAVCPDSTERKSPKNFLWGSGGFLALLRTQANYQSDVGWYIPKWWGKTCARTCGIWKSINRT